jgi:hypothetical protein
MKSEMITQSTDIAHIGQEFLKRGNLDFDKHEKSSLFKKFWTMILIGYLRGLRS